MPRDLAQGLARRVAVLAMTLAVVVLGVVTVAVAAQWRESSAPLEVAPVAVSAIQDELAGEQARADDLSGQMAQVAADVAALRETLRAAGETIAEDEDGAEALQAQLDEARARLNTLQGQLQAAQQRLEALRAAAARQAAIGGATGQNTISRSADDEDEEDEGEEEDDDD